MVNKMLMRESTEQMPLLIQTGRGGNRSATSTSIQSEQQQQQHILYICRVWTVGWASAGERLQGNCCRRTGLFIGTEFGLIRNDLSLFFAALYVR
jgi:hypothetical protein